MYHNLYSFNETKTIIRGRIEANQPDVAYEGDVSPTEDLMDYIDIKPKGEVIK